MDFYPTYITNAVYSTRELNRNIPSEKYTITFLKVEIVEV